MTMILTAQQREAVDRRGGNILVSAAAGAGKTGVLTQRVLAQLDEGCRIDELLVLTFTRAAAAEMRNRIREAIFQRLENAIEQKRRHFQRQLHLLADAPIATLDAFFIQIVRDHYQVVEGLDPKFRLFAAGQDSVFRDDLLREFIGSYYAHPDSIRRQHFEELVRLYGSGFNDDGLKRVILRLIDFGQSRGDLGQWLSASLRRFADDDFWYREVMTWGRRQIAAVLTLLEELLAYNERQGGPAGYSDSLREDIAGFRALQGADWDAIAAAQPMGTLKRKRKEDDSEIADVVKVRRKEIKTYFEKTQALFRRDFQDYAREMALVLPHMEHLVDLTLEFTEVCHRQQLRKNLFGFSDIAHMARQILATHPEIADSYRRRYREVLVDEYQDVNPLQEEILGYLSTPRNLFVVGDVKQSIYRFRFADHTLFRQRSVHYRQDPAAGANIVLNQNFRSRPAILGAVNFFFYQFMEEPYSGLPYGEEEALRAGAVYREQEKPAVEMTVVTSSAAEGAVSGGVAQGRYIAQRIRELIADKLTIGVGEECRPVTYGDIAILLRSLKPPAPEIVETLQQSGIPVHFAVKEGFTAAQEVRLLLAVLAVIDNPCQDIEFMAVLRSPLFGLDEEQLLQIGRRPRGQRVWTHLCHGDLAGVSGETVRDIVATIARWRAWAKLYAVADLLAMLIETTDYLAFWGGLPDGRQRLRRIDALRRLAADYQAENSGTLFNFLRYIKRLREQGGDVMDAAEEGRGAVTVTTIHKSKGLEFPVVFVARLEQTALNQRGQENLLLDGVFGFGPKYMDLINHTVTPTLPRLFITQREQQASYAEELRVLYVAMTRAREKLCLVGYIEPDRVGKIEEWQAQGARQEGLHLPIDLLNKNRASYLRWLCYGMGRHGERGVSLPADDTPIIFRVLEAPPLLPATAGEAVPPQSLAPAAFVRLQTALRREVSRKIPAKISVTALLESGYRQPLPRPAFLRGVGALTGAERGTAFHYLLERLPLDRAWDGPSLAAYKETLVREETSLATLMAAVDDEAALFFLASPYGLALRSATVVRREFSFTVAMPSAALYGDGGEETVILQGAIDLFYQRADGVWILLDYKTGRVAAEGDEIFLQRYGPQIDLYAAALQRLYQINVAEKVFYLSDERRFLRRE